MTEAEADVAAVASVEPAAPVVQKRAAKQKTPQQKSALEEVFASAAPQLRAACCRSFHGRCRAV
jgi:hypothetical protein